jgi:hypothetical protein
VLKLAWRGLTLIDTDMPIELPDFKNSHCVAVTACANIQFADRDILNSIKRGKETFAVFKTALGETNFRVLLGDNSGRHVHIDVASSSVINKQANPKTRLTLPQVKNKLEPFMGREVEVWLRGLFSVKLDELPANGIIRTLFVETKMGNVGIKTEGSQFAVSGAPVESISWHVMPKNKIGITLTSGILKTKISQSYIMEALHILESAFNVFIIGRPQNEPQ